MVHCVESYKKVVVAAYYLPGSLHDPKDEVWHFKLSLETDRGE